jgi:hypothetical protein
MYIGISVVVVFSFLLILSGGTEAGLNLLLIVGAPLLVLAIAGEALRLWSRRGAQRDQASLRTIFDQLAEFDQLSDSTDGQQPHQYPR